MIRLLEQTGPVNDLLKSSCLALTQIDNYEIRQQLEAAIQVFNRIICPSNISLDEVEELAEKYQIDITSDTAFDILKEAAMDIDFNYAGQAVEYHFDEYVMKTLP